MVSLLRKLIEDQKDRWFFAGMVVVSANAGGAWSPIGDVTTTMLWIKGQITAAEIVKVLIIPSIFTLLAPLAILSLRMKGNVTRPVRAESADHYTDPTTPFERNFVFSQVLPDWFLFQFSRPSSPPSFYGYDAFFRRVVANHRYYSPQKT